MSCFSIIFSTTEYQYLARAVRAAWGGHMGVGGAAERLRPGIGRDACYQSRFRGRFANPYVVAETTEVIQRVTNSHYKATPPYSC